MSYCEYVDSLPLDNVHKIYHDTQYGFPLDSDDELFGRLLLEINQAGLSWNTILNKQDNFRRAYSNYSIEKVASYNETEIARLLSDEGIIRNRLKINAAVHNAKVIIDLQNEFGSFKNWLDSQRDLNLEQWVKLFKKHFKFTGGEITKEFLMSTGYLTGAHIERCVIQNKILSLKPAYIRN
ncbi:DNA-3-methyladenine glycosylase I [Candidatus Dojkabacteria bacterium]|uniref:DNA-3-methyladenine glycosylase I n=1 Tax=Candidatus Dojkabacteria bacterium TaxID=2099670 RepID=A0A955RJN2_9BACT|nr:DNA-3-methyladenine glycosylase I [Candidatus Dojkabacteria bacterium]